MWGVVWLVVLVGCGRVGFGELSATGAETPDATPGGFDSNTMGAPTSGLVGWWTFDEDNGTTAADSSTAGNSGTLAGGAGWTTGGEVGGAVTLAVDGHVDLASTNGFPTTGSFTIAAWIELSTIAPGSVMSIDPRLSSPWVQSWMLGVHGAGCGNCATTILFVIGTDGTGGSTCLCGTTPLSSTNIWYHVAGVYDATLPQMDIYLNGQRDTGSFAYGTVPSAMYYDQTYFGNIGEVSQGWRFQGALDDVRVYDRALGATEITQLYTATGGS